MATATVLSDLITNTEATPRVMNNVCNEMGKLRVVSGIFESSSSLTYATNKFAAVCRLPADGSVKSIKLFFDGLATGIFDVGLYTGSVSTALTAADIDCYASAVDLGAGANTTGLEVAFEARDIANGNKRVYEDAGDTLGEFSDYWLCLTAQTEDAAAGTVLVTTILACA